MHNELSPIRLFLEASTTVQLVMLLLLLASIMSLGIIWKKYRTIKLAIASADKFEKLFWAGGDLTQILETTKDYAKIGMVGLFHAGFNEFSRQSKQDVSFSSLGRSR